MANLRERILKNSPWRAVLLAEGVFRFQVAASRERLQQIEFIELKKVLQQYYVDSVELAG